MANDPLNPSEGNPLERSPNSQPDMNGDLNAFKEKLGLSPEQTVDREQAIVRSGADREQAEANRKQEEAEQLNQAYKELGVQPKGDFNPDPPLKLASKMHPINTEAKRLTTKDNERPSDVLIGRQIQKRMKALKLEPSANKPEEKTYSPEDDSAWETAMAGEV